MGFSKLSPYVTVFEWEQRLVVCFGAMKVRLTIQGARFSNEYSIQRTEPGISITHCALGDSATNQRDGLDSNEPSKDGLKRQNRSSVEWERKRIHGEGSRKVSPIRRAKLRESKTGWFFSLIILTMSIVFLEHGSLYAQGIASAACHDEVDDAQELVASCSLVIDGGSANRSDIANAYRNRAIGYIELSELMQALSDLNDSLAADTANPSTHTRLGDVNWALGQYQDAVESYSAALEIDPRLTIALNGRALSYMALREFASAYVDIYRALDIDPHDGLLHRGLGYIFFEDRQYRSAIDSLDRSIELLPTDPTAHNLRGNAYAGIEQYDRALQDIRQAIILDPNSAIYYGDLARILSSIGNYGEALESFETAIELDAHRASVFHHRGILFTRLGEYELAVDDFSRAIELSPAASTTYHNRAIANCRMSNIEESIDDLVSALELPGPPNIVPLQIFLHENSYYPGPIDGVISASTLDAIARYQMEACSDEPASIPKRVHYPGTGSGGFAGYGGS